jgi:hypothetical protein
MSENEWDSIPHIVGFYKIHTKSYSKFRNFKKKLQNKLKFGKKCKFLNFNSFLWHEFLISYYATKIAAEFFEVNKQEGFYSKGAELTHNSSSNMVCEQGPSISYYLSVGEWW